MKYSESKMNTKEREKYNMKPYKMFKMSKLMIKVIIWFIVFTILFAHMVLLVESKRADELIEHVGTHKRNKPVIDLVDSFSLFDSYNPCDNFCAKLCSKKVGE